MLEVVDTPPMDLLAANMVNLGSQRSSKMRNSELIQGQPTHSSPKTPRSTCLGDDVKGQAFLAASVLPFRWLPNKTKTIRNVEGVKKECVSLCCRKTKHPDRRDENPSFSISAFQNETKPFPYWEKIGFSTPMSKRFNGYHSTSCVVLDSSVCERQMMPE